MVLADRIAKYHPARFVHRGGALACGFAAVDALVFDRRLGPTAIDPNARGSA